MRASVWGHTEIVEKLLNYGVSVDDTGRVRLKRLIK
jgi:hypothetical protein